VELGWDVLPVARGGLLVETPLVLGGEGVTSLEDRTVTVNALAKTYADRGGTWAKVMAMFTSGFTGKTARGSMSVRRGIHA